MTTISINDHLPIQLTEWEKMLDISPAHIGLVLRHVRIDSKGMAHIPDASPMVLTAVARRALGQSEVTYIGRDLRDWYVYA